MDNLLSLQWGGFLGGIFFAIFVAYIWGAWKEYKEYKETCKRWETRMVQKACKEWKEDNDGSK